MIDRSVPFKRGATFSFMLQLPSAVTGGFFIDWETRARIRKEKNDTPNGVISELDTAWDDPETAKVLRVTSTQDTSEWPLGKAELDVRFEHSDGTVVYSKTIEFNIVDEVTK